MIDAISTAVQGMYEAQRKLDRTARQVATAEGPGELPEALVGLHQAEWAMKANTAVVQAADRMVGTLLDELA